MHQVAPTWFQNKTFRILIEYGTLKDNLIGWYKHFDWKDLNESPKTEFSTMKNCFSEKNNDFDNIVNFTNFLKIQYAIQIQIKFSNQLWNKGNLLHGLMTVTKILPHPVVYKQWVSLLTYLKKNYFLIFKKALS